MATSRRAVRSTRKLLEWTVEQVESGNFPGLIWDDPPAKTMFRIPWKHAGKQEFRDEEDAGFFKAWAIFKGKHRPGQDNAAAWKTRIRCALSKSPEFEHVPERSRLDIPEPYKVYRLVPISEQVAVKKAKAPKAKQINKSKKCATSKDQIPPPVDSLLLLKVMQSLTSCECIICPECFAMHFIVVVKERHITDLVCPACSEPVISDERELLNYFSTLDIQLRSCLDQETYELFHKKLTEHVLMQDPKFQWCTHCSFGFIYEREQLEAKCPQCSKSFCVQCKRQWEPQHQGLSCDQFLEWKRTNDPEYQAQGLAVYLQENGIACPKCKFSYALARGGCMHFQCSQCRHHFCSGCYGTFYAQNKCPIASCPIRRSLHGHHPRDCLFYLRDWNVPRLQRLLQDNNVAFNTDPPAGTRTVPGGGCRVMEQKETLEGLKDEPCGKETPAEYAGLCQAHYKEYLVSLINSHTLDPAVLYTLQEADIVCRRHLSAAQVPPRGPEEDEEAYRQRLVKVLKDEVPLGMEAPSRRK